MTNIGINGFGRIGKSLFIQLLDNPNIKVAAINAPSFDIKYIETYLKYDSVHKYKNDWSIKVIDSNSFMINNLIVYMFANRDAKQLDWKRFGIDYVIDATGSYLTTDKTKDHNVPYVIMCAPPKDKTPLFVYKVNHQKYNGEHIVSNASCTTNCITPVLKFLDDKYGIKNANFTTIHAATGSQSTVDVLNSNNRTHRSIFNNIIPHTTGATSSISELIPSLTDKVFGTSLRVPVSNVSLVDLNVELVNDVSLDDIFAELSSDDFIKIINLNLVSCDFMTTTCPSIIDKRASMHLGENRFKIMIWYDNEWSYSAQVIKLLEHMISHNTPKFIDRYNFFGKNVILRVDWNIPTKDGIILDDYRIVSSLPTIKRILADSPNRIVIISHFGRPKGWTERYSWFRYLEQIQKYFTDDIYFLKDGLTNETLSTLQNTTSKLYLLENIRFHAVETYYKNYPEDNLERVVISKLGDFYINDAFGCSHRDHLSICGIKTPEKAYGYLINKEVDALKVLLDGDRSEKVLAIIGGAKMDDKLPLLTSLSKKMDYIFVGGGNINSILKNNMGDFIKNISSNKAEIHLMKDGLCAPDLNTMYSYKSAKDLPENNYFYDIGSEGLIDLSRLIDKSDIIFWNGSMGVVENSLYENGSITLMNLLINSGKKVIVGGGDTACFVSKFQHNFYHVSTGGGSTIDYISNGSLVGLDYFV